MRTETKTVNVFRFAELSEDAKEKAKQDYAALFGYSWADEAMESIQALAKHFGGRASDWEIDWFRCSPSSMSFVMPEMDAKEIRAGLKELGTYNRKTLKGNGECKLTGVCFDEDAIDGFRLAFIRDKETDLNALMQAAFYSWLKACHDDCEDAYTDERFGETCEANDWEFNEDGSFHR